MTLGKLISPLNLDLDELELELEWLPLYGEFAERFNEALDLVAAGIEMWRPDEREEWAIEAAAAISRKLYNIEQALNRFPTLGIAWAVRNAGSWEERATDSQLAAALAMAYGCRAINVLRTWLAQLADRMVEASGRALVEDTIINYPDVYAAIINDHRLEDSVAEIEARESAADLLGRARNSIIFAELYRNPNISPEEMARLNEQAVKKSRAETGRKGGEKSGVSRRQDSVSRDQRICRTGKGLLAQGRSAREISGIITGMPVAEGITRKTVLKVLRDGGVLPSADNEREVN
ncbi:hypothetical protein [Pseudomonas putida]|uniref:hypothetical protein n=1 Tax=Pseudomonas TaxID=286 RepID=UPI00346775A8